MSAVHIDQERLRQIVRYEDGKLFWLPRYEAKFDKQFACQQAGYYDKKNRRYTMRWGKGSILLHRAIWVYHHGPIPEGMEIDHINNDSSDNRIENLRLCTRLQNMMNIRIAKCNKSGIKGVMWNKATKSWRARIQINKKSVQIGLFDCLGKAKIAIMEARNNFHKEFANHGRRLA